MKIYHSWKLEQSSSRHTGQRKKENHARAQVDTAIKKSLDELRSDNNRQAAFLRLLACVRTRTSLLKLVPGRGGSNWIALVFLVHRLKNVAARHRFWIRTIETWRPDCVDFRRMFRSLIHHLFGRYSVPGFMDSVWDMPTGPDAFRQQVWWIRLARGSSLRSLNLPIRLTRRMEHHARCAPDHFKVVQALRYGEMRGLGGSECVACAIAESRLGRATDEFSFWRTVLNFIAAHPELPLSRLSAIIDYIQTNKFAGEEVLTANGLESRAAPWPEFSMKGRTPQALLRLVDAWHFELPTAERHPCSWRHGLQAFRYLERRTDGSELDWSIVELLNPSALYAEDRAMHHCVYTYSDRCFRRESSIWSLRLRAEGREKRMATIEVDPSCRTVVQVRARHNRRPGHRSRSIIRQWAIAAGLVVGRCR